MRKKIGLLIVIAALPAQAYSVTDDDLLALVTMPLAVAAAADLPQVPPGPLGELVALLNEAAIPPAEIVQAIRYAPVAFVEEPQFVPYVRGRYDDGQRGDALMRTIEHKYETYGLPDINLVVTAPPLPPLPAPRLIIPDVVRTRVEEHSRHPHGGPPGQLKKELGLQTGAEVVHGQKPGRLFEKGVNATGPKHMKHGGGKSHGKPHGKGGGHGHGKGKH